MARQELLSSAARLIRIVDPTDGDLRWLEKECHIHPADTAAMLNHQVNRLSRYRDYQAITINLPVEQHHELAVATFHFIIGQNYLIAIGDLPARVIKHFWDEIPVTLERGWQTCQSWALFIEVIRRLVQETNATLPKELSVGTTTILGTAAATLSELAADWSTDQIKNKSEAIDELKLSVHLLRPRSAQITSASDQKSNRQPRSNRRIWPPIWATGYAIAALGILLVVFLVR